MTHRERFPREHILGVLDVVVGAIGPLIERHAFVGSFRRRMETCGDADLLVIPSDDGLGTVLRSLGGRSFVGGSDFIYILIGDTPVNVFVTAPVSWGSALQYTTGSREHNLAIRSYAKDHDLLANQFGVFRRAGPRTAGPKIAGSSETESGFYGALGLRWVRPENRCKSPRGNGVIPLTR